MSDTLDGLTTLNAVEEQLVLISSSSTSSSSGRGIRTNTSTGATSPHRCSGGLWKKAGNEAPVGEGHFSLKDDRRRIAPVLKSLVRRRGWSVGL